MASVEELIRKYQDYPDRRLVEMLKHRNDYISEAVKAAQAVLDKRSIKQEQIDEIIDELTQKEKEKRAESNRPLSTEEKLLFMFVPLVGLVSLLIAATEEQSKGKAKRVSEIFVFAAIGLLLFSVILWVFGN